MAPLLSVEGVSKEFQVRGKRIVALESITLALEQGEFVTVVGPSGCGKSTLLNLIVGLLGPSSGRILLRGRPIDGVNPEIGYVTQKDNLLPWRTLYQTSLFSTTGALAVILIVAAIVVLSSEAINWAEAYLLRWRPQEEARTEREVY
jgi:ABC-type nitrate/sulfonate/bicarbonate transport system ATPase subunit